MPIIGSYGAISGRGFGHQSGGITYTITPSVTNLNEGSSVTLTVTTKGFGTGTLYWTINQVSGTINNTDFSSPASAVTAGGSVSVTNNSGSFSLTLANDLTTEGTESFSVSLRTGSTTGPVVSTTATISINDTSVTPSFPFFPYFPFFPTFPYFPYFPFFPTFPYFAPTPTPTPTPTPVPSFPYFIGCVHGDTLIRTTDGHIKARDVYVGQKLASYTFTELPRNRELYDVELWTSDTLNGDNITETTVESIKVREVAVTVMLNGKDRRFSLEHMLLARRDNTYMFIQAGVLRQGDYLVYDINNRMADVLVESIGYKNEVTDVYDFSVTPNDLFIAGDIIAHNKKGFFQGPTKRDA